MTVGRKQLSSFKTLLITKWQHHPTASYLEAWLSNDRIPIREAVNLK